MADRDSPRRTLTCAFGVDDDAGSACLLRGKQERATQEPYPAASPAIQDSILAASLNSQARDCSGITLGRLKGGGGRYSEKTVCSTVAEPVLSVSWIRDRRDGPVITHTAYMPGIGRHQLLGYTKCLRSMYVHVARPRPTPRPFVRSIYPSRLMPLHEVMPIWVSSDKPAIDMLSGFSERNLPRQ